MKTMITVRCEVELANKFKRLAQIEGRSSGNMLEWLIKNYKGEVNMKNEILQELKMAGVKDADAIIDTMMIAFNVKEVNQDVVDALREDYLKD